MVSYSWVRAQLPPRLCIQRTEGCPGDSGPFLEERVTLETLPKGTAAEVGGGEVVFI